MSAIQTISEVILIPRSNGESPILLELKDTKYAESRVPDLRIVTPGNAPDLLASFAEGLNELAKAMGYLSLEVIKAQTRLDRRKAELILNEIPTILEKKGLRSSEDLRNAVLALDESYCKLNEEVKSLESVFENLKIKYKNLDSARFDVKTVMQSRQQIPRRDHTNDDFGIGHIDGTS